MNSSTLLDVQRCLNISEQCLSLHYDYVNLSPNHGLATSALWIRETAEIAQGKLTWELEADSTIQSRK